jgi:hypothetical protein
MPLLFLVSQTYIQFIHIGLELLSAPPPAIVKKIVPQLLYSYFPVSCSSAGLKVGTGEGSAHSPACVWGAAGPTCQPFFICWHGKNHKHGRVPRSERGKGWGGGGGWVLNLDSTKYLLKCLLVGQYFRWRGDPPTEMKSCMMDNLMGSGCPLLQPFLIIDKCFEQTFPTKHPSQLLSII